MTRPWAKSRYLAVGVAVVTILCASVGAQAQVVDCNRLAAQIAAAGQGGGRQFAAAAQKQRAELARTSAYASSLGCDRPNFFLFGERPPQCAGINAQIARMQANLQSLSQAEAYGGNGTRAMLQQRFDTYCRNAAGYNPAQNFFERLFNPGMPEQMREFPPEESVRAPEDDEDGNRTARGGSQAVCVRTCDGGYFPMSVPARRRDLSELQDLCAALCPGTEAKLYTKVPGREISSAVSVSGDPYSDLPNALKFEKTFDKTCTCKPANKSWAEALADAEQILGNGKGDIVVTPEKAEELSRIAGPAGKRDKSRKFDANAIAKAVGVPAADDAARAAVERQKKSADEAIASDAAAAASAPTAGTESSGIGRTGADNTRVVGKTEGAKTDEALPGGGRRKVRIIPQ